MALNFLKQLISLGHLSLEKGLKFGGEKLLIGFLSHLSEEEYLQVKFTTNYNQVRYLAGKQIGRNFVKNYGVPLGKLLPEVISISENVLSAFGWGSFKTFSYDEEKKFLVIHATESTIADAIKLKHGPQKKPIDFAFAGIMAGAVSYYSKDYVVCIETKCRVQENVDSCEFVAGPEKTVLQFVKKYYSPSVRDAKKFFDEIKSLEKKFEVI